MRMTRPMLIALSLSVGAWDRPTEPVVMDPTSRLWIDGKSTVRKFSCNAPAFTLDIDAVPNVPAALLTGAKPTVRAAVLKVAAEKMECGNGTMNEHMLKALKAKEAPTITFSMQSYDVARAEDGVDGTLRGMLSLGGVERPVTLNAHAVAGGNGALRLTGAYTLNMKDFGLKPPSLMMGTMRVDPLVVVNFDLLLKSTTVASATGA